MKNIVSIITAMSVLSGSIGSSYAFASESETILEQNAQILLVESSPIGDNNYLENSSSDSFCVIKKEFPESCPKSCKETSGKTKKVSRKNSNNESSIQSAKSLKAQKKENSKKQNSNDEKTGFFCKFTSLFKCSKPTEKATIPYSVDNSHVKEAEKKIKTAPKKQCKPVIDKKNSRRQRKLSPKHNKNLKPTKSVENTDCNSCKKEKRFVEVCNYLTHKKAVRSEKKQATASEKASHVSKKDSTDKINDKYRTYPVLSRKNLFPAKAAAALGIGITAVGILAVLILNSGTGHTN